MPRRVTPEDIIEINEVYLEQGTYAATARIMGFSPSTVKKYILEDYVSRKNIVVSEFDKQIKKVSEIKLPDRYNEKELQKLLTLNPDEQAALDTLKKEILI